MAQKTKVKELVGRGLNSYHTKALQQMDRIEKKNKEQNHKISILSNELDNDYLTKTEEGSVISLEHSKEGMVYLDELQGNTMVNYCTDGSKEMTLNGDIDVEGTFVTTTEGVDNGKVDVLCEGNTLVNYFDRTKFMIPKNTQHTINGRYQIQSIQTLPTKVGDKVYFRTKFSVDEFNTTSATPKVCVLFTGGWRQTVKNFIDCRIGDKEEVSIIREHPQNLESQPNMLLEFGMYGEMPSDVESGNIVCKYTVYDYVSYNLTQMFGKGNEPTQEWCDKNLPYIEGMKSVGQDDESGHKIEILSAKGKPNLFKNSGFLNGFKNYSINNVATYEIVDDNSTFSKKALKFTTGTKGISGIYQYQIIPYIENIKYTISGWCKGEVGTTLQIHIERHKNINVNFTNEEWVRFEITSETNPTNWNRTITFYSPNNNKVFYLKDIKAEKSDFATPYIPHTTESHYSSFMNKKEISLNEPLRGVNNVKDKFVKIGGKWFIERNCIGVQFKDLKYTAVNIYLKDEFPDVIGFRLMGTGVNSPIMCDKYAYTNDRIINFGQLLTNEEYINVYNSGKEFFITIKKAKLETLDIEGLMNYFSNNSLEIVGKADSTTYEPITDATLTTYLDTTHISNNSIIPCNMKIKNTGYNAIIKPSTLYTVALDTNYNGTIGMNLGGAKVTTTNNVATITTPATLTDDSLRLYGKDIKGSKVRLLEGDKTNWIPSFFEGMKSSFEDKLQDDGTYKMEILSHTKKLQNQLLDPNLKTHSFQRTTIDGDWNIFQWNIGDYYLSSKNVIDGDKFKNGDKIYIKFDVIKLSDAHYTGTIWCGRIGGYNTTIFSGEFYNSLPINQQKTLKTIITHNPPDNDPRTFKIDFGDYGRDIECNFKIKDITVVNLTRLYGKGNEPTVEWCDENIPYYNTNDMHYVDMNKIHFSSIEPLRKWDRFVFKDGKLMIERYSKKVDLGVEWSSKQVLNTGIYRYTLNNVEGIYSMAETICNTITTVTIDDISDKVLKYFNNGIWYQTYDDFTLEELKEYFTNSNTSLIFKLKEPTYEEIPHELQKIILEGYENGTLFFDTNIPPTSTVTYAGETPIVKSVRLNKTEVLNNTNDINDNIIPYLMDMDYRVVMLQLATEELEGGVSMARLFGGTYEMIKRDILSKRLTREEYGYRLADYYNAGKLTEEQVRELEELR